MFVFFFFNDTATTEIYTLSLHDALPILDTPMVIEVSLHYLHLLTGSILGILLHLCVESGVDFQTCSIQVDAIIVAPIAQIVGYRLTEILCLAVVVLFYFIIKCDGKLLQGVAFGTRKVMVLYHIVKHYVPSRQAILRVRTRVIESCCLQHTHQYSRLIGRHIGRSGVKVGLCCRFNTV